jgi:hypothetical protein
MFWIVTFLAIQTPFLSVRFLKTTFTKAGCAFLSTYCWLRVWDVNNRSLVRKNMHFWSKRFYRDDIIKWGIRFLIWSKFSFKMFELNQSQCLRMWTEASYFSPQNSTFREYDTWQTATDFLLSTRVVIHYFAWSSLHRHIVAQNAFSLWKINYFNIDYWPNEGAPKHGSFAVTDI